jgi:four helix bundle protein
MKITNFQDLEIWQLGKELSVFIYTLTNKGNFCKDYGLRDQIRRSCVSIPSNIAEGFERDNNNELINYLRIAKGSCSEAITQIIISSEILYISKEEKNILLSKLNLLSSKIACFIIYLKNNRIKQKKLKLTR